MISVFLDFLFPPLCLNCKERCKTKHLCPACWELCAPPDPAERCRHCFCDLDLNKGMCAQCRREPLLPAARAFVFDGEAPARLLGFDAVEAFAGFAFNQWTRLEWPEPDAIIPMPDCESSALGKVFAALTNRTVTKALHGEGEWMELRADPLKEGDELLLIDVSNPLHRLQKAVSILSESFPKRIYLLTLFQYVVPILKPDPLSRFPRTGI